MDLVVPIEVAAGQTVEFLAAAAEFAAEVFRDEKQRSANGDFMPIGRRIVAAR